MARRNPAELAANRLIKKLNPVIDGMAKEVKKKIAAGETADQAVIGAVKKYGLSRVKEKGVTDAVSVLIGRITDTEQGPGFRRWWLNNSWKGEDLSLSAKINDLARMDDTKEVIRSSLRNAESWKQMANTLAESDLTKADLAQHVQTLTDSARRVMAGDTEAIQEYQAALKSSMRQVERLAQNGAPTQRLQSAYRDVINKTDSASGEAVNNAIDRLVKEKMRYNAERIARTEMGKAYAQATYADALDDDQVIGIGYDLNSGHIIRDICCHPNTMVDGKLISSIEKGQIIRTHTGSMKTIGKVYKNKSSNMFKITFCNLIPGAEYQSVILTHNHPVLTVKGWIPVSGLKKGFLCICQPLKADDLNHQQIYGDTGTTEQCSSQNDNLCNRGNNDGLLCGVPGLAQKSKPYNTSRLNIFAIVKNRFCIRGISRPSSSDFYRLYECLRGVFGILENVGKDLDGVSRNLDSLRLCMGHTLVGNISDSYLWGGTLSYKLNRYVVLLHGIFDNNYYCRIFCRNLLRIRCIDLFFRTVGRPFRFLKPFKVILFKICDNGFSYIKYKLSSVNNQEGKIISIESFPYDGIVYNLGVDGNQTYFANGLLVHNCDFHTSADLFGIGPGRYPLEALPEYPFHQNCLCTSYSVYSGDVKAFNPKAGAGFIRRLPADEKILLLGRKGAEAFNRNPETWQDSLKNYNGYQNIKSLQKAPVNKSDN